MYFPGPGQTKDGYDGQFRFRERSQDPGTIRVSRYPAGTRRLLMNARRGLDEM